MSATIKYVKRYINETKKFTDHNHENSEVLYNELKALNLIKSNCEKTSTVLSDVNALSGKRSVFQDTCDT